VNALMIRRLSLVAITVLLLIAVLVRNRETSDVVINWNAARQTIDGFGASATGYAGTITQAEADRWFSPETGLGLSLLRIKIIPDTVRDDCSCVANSSPHACVTGSKSQILSGDLQIARLAVERGVTVFASPWSPPAEMKSSGRYCGGGSMLGTPANYAEYAADLASFPALLRTRGVAIDAVSVQNEPDLEESYDTCRWTARQIHDFIPYLAGALRTAGFSGVKVAAPEESDWTFEMMDEAMGDPSVAADVGLLLGHAYRPETPAAAPAVHGLHVWQSEVSDFRDFDGSMQDALWWARSIHEYMIAGANAWMYWNLDCGTAYFNNRNNMCLTGQAGNLAKRAYVLAQYAKFVRPGWQRIDVGNRGPLLVTAYKGPSRRFAIVIVNNSRLTARDQTFRLNGFTSERSTVMPWLTSSTVSLAPQSPIAASSGGTAIRFTIPAGSVVTLAGQADQNYSHQ